MSLRIPLVGQEDLPWRYFVLSAARGAVQVPEWVLLAVPTLVGRRLNTPPEAITGEDIEAALRYLPPDPRPGLDRLLTEVGLPVPDPASSPLLLQDGEVCGAFREPVSSSHLLHDAAVLVQVDYGADSFFRYTDSLDQRAWDARVAVGVMMYLLLLSG